MKNSAIIIPTRLKAKRFPNKPLAKINNIPMIIHTLNRGLESGVGEVFVATPDDEILEIVKKHGGHAIMTGDHPNGTSRVFEAFKKIKNENVDLIMNLQGDLPNILPSSIAKLNKLMRENNSSPIGTLASELNKDEIDDQNVVKVEVETDLKEDSFSKAKDFFRIKKDLKNEKIYHHVGIYCFQPSCLKQYVELSETEQEKILKLEQMRVMGKIDINVGYCDSSPLSVDTLEDLKQVEKEMS